MKGLGIPIILQALGVLIIIAEIILPSAGLLTLLAMAIFGYSIFLVFDTFPSSVGMIFIGADLIVIPLLLYVGLKLLAKSPVTLQTVLSRGKGVSSQSDNLDFYLGKTGTALTALRPAGTARIEKKRVDVVSRGDFIEKGSSILVVEVTGNQIIVANNSNSTASQTNK